MHSIDPLMYYPASKSQETSDVFERARKWLESCPSSYEDEEKNKMYNNNNNYNNNNHDNNNLLN